MMKSQHSFIGEGFHPLALPEGYLNKEIFTVRCPRGTGRDADDRQGNGLAVAPRRVFSLHLRYAPEQAREVKAQAKIAL